MNNFPPSVNAFDSTVELGSLIDLQTRFTVSDIDPNSFVTRFRFRDTNTAPQSGYFVYDGVPWQQGLLLEVAAADLHKVQYRSAAIISSELINIQAYDGTFWSDPDAALYYSVLPNVDPPVVSGTGFSVVSLEFVKVADFISASDPNGYPILEYLVHESSSDIHGGFLTLNNVQLAPNTWHSLTPTEFSQLVYTGAKYGTSEALAVHARDAGAWSDIAFFTATTIPNLSNPTVMANGLTMDLGESLTADHLFSYSDADGNKMRWVQFKDLGVSPNSAYFALNGVKQAAGEWIRVATEDLHTLTYNAGTVLGTENFQVQVWDGARLSTISQATATTTQVPVATGDRLRMMDSFERAPLSSFVDIQTAIGAINYEVIDMNDLPSSGSMVLYGGDLEPGVIHTLNPQEFADLYVRGGADDLGRSYDRFMVRVNNGYDKSAWTAFEVSTDPVNQDGVLGLGEWSYDGPQLQLTYNFPQVVPTYYCPDFEECTDNRPILDVGMRTAIRDILDQYETFINVRYTEVSATAQFADVTFMLTDADPDAGAYAYAPGTVGSYSVNGDMWGNGLYEDDLLMSNPGEYGHFVWIHENGHSLGLKHTFQGNSQLPTPIDSDRFSVMSYTNTYQDGGQIVYPSSPMLYDIMALQFLYGANPTYRAGNTHIRIDPDSPIPHTIYDSGGFDTLNLTQHNLNVTVNLASGQFSSVGGLTDNVAIAWGTDIENARGGKGNDTLIGNELNNLLFGNEGDDRLEGSIGQDVLRGQVGNDTYVWRIGDGFDQIREELGAGWDRIEIHLFDEYDMGDDTLMEWFQFRREGVDLRVDLNFRDGELDGGLRIMEMGYGKNRVETLQLFDFEGDQIGPDINLRSIYDNASLTGTQFQLTTNTSKYGNLAVPVS